MASTLEIARNYYRRGWCPLPIPSGKKRPRLKGWSGATRETIDLDAHFGNGPGNVGILLGAPSGHLVDIDLDCDEALALAPAFLPSTNAVFGRSSRSCSHYLFRSVVESQRFTDPKDKKTLLEVRSDGCQTVFPGSTHTSGEPITWHEEGEPSGVEADILLSATKRLAAATLLARHWPEAGGRHDAQLTLSACLVRAGWDVEEVARFVAAVARAAGGEAELEKRRATARDAQARLESDRTLRGVPRLIELLGKGVAQRVIEWLGLEPLAASVGRPRSAEDHATAPLSIGSDIELARTLQDLLTADCGQVVYSLGRLWHFQETHWAPLAPSLVRRCVQDFDGLPHGPSGRLVKLSKARIDSVLNEFHVLADVPDFFSGAAVGINCASGLIVFSADGTPSLVPQAPEHSARYVVEGHWPCVLDDADAAGSLLYKLFNGVFQGDPDGPQKVDLIGEMIAAAALGLATKLPAPKAFVLHGATADNGKSQMLELLRHFLPAEVVAAVPAHKLQDEKYLARLEGCLLNACDEASSADAIASNVFKQLVTGDPVSARDVYSSVRTFTPRALQVLAANVLPAFAGGADRGVRRRLCVIEFNRSIPMSEQIVAIGKRICTEEADLLLDFVVQSASRLIRQSRFTSPASSVAALRDWFRSSDPVQAWVEHCVVVDPHAPPLPSRDAYRDFANWAVGEGFERNRLPAVPAFAQRLKSVIPGVRSDRTSRQRRLLGVRLVSSGTSQAAESDGHDGRRHG